MFQWIKGKTIIKIGDMMYLILLWLEKDEYLTCLHNEDGSIRLFEDLNSADIYANQIDPKSESTRVISIEGVKE